MKPPYAVYLIESCWSWDHTNTEIATTTVEGTEGQRWEPEYEKLLDPEFSQLRKQQILDHLKAVAKEQNKCQMDSTPHLCALYRVTDIEGLFYGSPSHERDVELKMKLELICRFDSQGNPLNPWVSRQG